MKNDYTTNSHYLSFTFLFMDWERFVNLNLYFQAPSISFRTCSRYLSFFRGTCSCSFFFVMQLNSFLGLYFSRKVLASEESWVCCGFNDGESTTQKRKELFLRNWQVVVSLPPRLPKYAAEFIEMCLMITADHGPGMSLLRRRGYGTTFCFAALFAASSLRQWFLV